MSIILRQRKDWERKKDDHAINFIGNFLWLGLRGEEKRRLIYRKSLKCPTKYVLSTLRLGKDFTRL